MCICLLLLLSFSNCEFHILQAGDKRRCGLLYPSLNKIQDRNGELYREKHSLKAGENENESTSVSLTSRTGMIS